MIELSPSGLSREALKALQAVVGPEHVSTTDEQRLVYSRDCWAISMLWMQQDRVPYPPDAVVWPGSTGEVGAVLRVAAEHRLPVVPYGAGSGVCGGTIPLKAGLILDLKRMDRLLEIDEVSLLATVEPGLNGEHFERLLNASGYTCGHFPSSMYCSTVGGWVAARGAGQMSTLYGKIEDLVVGMEVVTPTGEVASTLAVPRSATGPDWNNVFTGSEGTLGVITRVTLRIFPTPPCRLFRAFRFKGVKEGIDAVRRVMRTGVRPAAVRLYDTLDTFLVARKSDKKKEGTGPLGKLAKRVQDLIPEKLKQQGLKLALARPDVLNWLVDAAPGQCLLVFTFEGEPEICRASQQVVLRTLDGPEVTDLGPQPAQHWFEHRYDVSYKQSEVFRGGSFVDTFEVAAPWSKLYGLYRQVKEAISPYALVLAHFSHAYSDGSNIYFTFASQGKTPEESEQIYRTIWQRALEACQEAGGTISHHHGVGMQKGAFLKKQLGPLHEVFRGLKKVMDPDGLLNPGKLGL